MFHIAASLPLGGRAIAIAAGVLIVAYLARAYWLAPLLVWIRTDGTGATRYWPVDDGHPMPGAAAAHLAQRAEQLAALGFTAAAPFCETADGGMSLYHQLHHHADTGDVALIGALVRDASGEPANVYTGFRRELRDGSEVRTVHDALPAPYPDPPGVTVLRVGAALHLSDSAHDLTRLLQMHRALVQRQGSARPRDPDLSDPIAYHRRLADLSRRRMLESGWYYEDEASRIRPSLRGSWAMVWRQLAPWSWLLRSRELRLAESLLFDVVKDELMTAAFAGASRSPYN